MLHKEGAGFWVGKGVVRSARCALEASLLVCVCSHVNVQRAGAGAGKSALKGEENRKREKHKTAASN